MRADKINTFEKFKKIAIENMKFLNASVYKCPIITSYKVINKYLLISFYKWKPLLSEKE